MVTVVEGERRVVGADAEPAPSPGGLLHPPPRPPPPPPPPTGHRSLGFAIGGVGLVGLGVAGVSGGLLVSKNSAVQTGCPGKVCTPDGRAAIDATKPLMVVNAVGWGVGLAGVGVGAVLVLTSKSGSPAAATTVGATVLPGGGGLSLAGSFR